MRSICIYLVSRALLIYTRKERFWLLLESIILTATKRLQLSIAVFLRDNYKKSFISVDQQGSGLVTMTESVNACFSFEIFWNVDAIVDGIFLLFPLDKCIWQISHLHTIKGEQGFSQWLRRSQPLHFIAHWIHPP